MRWARYLALPMGEPRLLETFATYPHTKVERIAIDTLHKLFYKHLPNRAG